MSRRTQLVASLEKAARDRGGSHLTREARKMAYRTFAKWCYSALGNVQIPGPRSIKIKHVKKFLAEQKKAGVQNRTLQNTMAHLRTALRGCARGDFADGDLISNRALGLQGTRKGFHEPLSPEKYQSALDALRVKDAGAGSVLELCRTLGMRREEAVRSDVERLSRYLRDLKAGRAVAIDAATTKGGRPRSIELTAGQRAAATSAVERALSVTGANGYLIIAPDRPKAVKKYANLAARVGELTAEQSTHSALVVGPGTCIRGCGPRASRRAKLSRAWRSPWGTVRAAGAGAGWCICAV